MAHSSISERLALLRGRGGARASAYWLLRAVTRLDVYVLYSTNLQNRRPASALPEGHRLLKLASLSDLRDCSPLLIDTLDAQSGCGVVSALRSGGRIYALLHEDELLSQLKIDIGRITVDTPCDLTFDVGARHTILSFLFTPSSGRRGGWARRLIESVCASLAEEGFAQCTCHVQATNVRSRNTFASSGWFPAGWLLASAGGRFLGIVRRNQVELKVDARGSVSS